MSHTTRLRWSLIGLTISATTALILAFYELDHDPEGRMIPLGLIMGLISVGFAFASRRFRLAVESE